MMLPAAKSGEIRPASVASRGRDGAETSAGAGTYRPLREAARCPPAASASAVTCQ